MGEAIEYPDVLQEIRGAMNPGRLKLQSGNIVFKNLKTGKVDQFSSTDVEATKWLIRARGHCLKIILTNGTVHRFDGFKESEYDKLSSFISKFYDTNLEKVDMSLKGWNWGTAKFVGNSLDFEVGRGVAFEIPLGNVSHSVTNKNEVTLEFHQNDDAAVSLTELRFHVPSDSTNTENAVEEFYNNIMAKADIIQATGESIALFSDVQCLTPRGRYDIKMYPTFLQLHGKTFDYKVPYTSILRLFLLPHKDQRQMFFVVSLDPPIKQGQTRYHFLILLFNKDDETTLELSLSEEDLKEKYDGKLSSSISGNEYEVVSRIMKALVNRKITVPGSFSSHQKSHCIGCSYKAGTGLLYPLERGFIFVHKPAIHVRFDEISSVNFARSTSNLKSFDFEVETKAATVYTFVGMEKDEYSKLFDFVTQRKLRVKNIGGSKSSKSNYEDMMDSDEDGGHDAYLERMKAEGKQRDDDDDDEDEDSSEDEDFQAPENSGSEVAEEYDTDAGSSSSDEGSGADAGAKDENRKDKPKKKVKTVRERIPKAERPEKKERKKKKVPTATLR